MRSIKKILLIGFLLAIMIIAISFIQFRGLGKRVHYQ